MQKLNQLTRKIIYFLIWVSKLIIISFLEDFKIRKPYKTSAQTTGTVYSKSIQFFITENYITEMIFIILLRDEARLQDIGNNTQTLL